MRASASKETATEHRSVLWLPPDLSDGQLQAPQDWRHCQLAQRDSGVQDDGTLLGEHRKVLVLCSTGWLPRAALVGGRTWGTWGALMVLHLHVHVVTVALPQ